jgi:hypothetical protein
MPALAALLIPLIPGLVNSILGIIDTIKNHDATPEATKAHLAQISADLQAINVKVQATPLPD